jgi:diguanylate cyclase (GGDEF)-like protein
VPPLHLREADDVGKALMLASEMLQYAKFQSTHDALTGLANRLLFNEIVNQQISVSERADSSLAVIYVDLDGFKAVNDAHGHSFGDLLLHQVAERLKSGIRESDVAARLGGDEFAALLLGASELSAMTAANKLVEMLSVPYTIKDVQVSISASIGVACYPECGKTSQELLQIADKCMYSAKAGGKRQVVSASSLLESSLPPANREVHNQTRFESEDAL